MQEPSHAHTNACIVREEKQEAHGPHRSPEEDIDMFSISFYKLAIIYPCRRAWLII